MNCFHGRCAATRSQAFKQSGVFFAIAFFLETRTQESWCASDYALNSITLKAELFRNPDMEQRYILGENLSSTQSVCVERYRNEYNRITDKALYQCLNKAAKAPARPIFLTEDTRKISPTGA